MQRLLITSLLAAFGLLGIAAECAVDPRQRAIEYDPNMTIADRLTTGDKEVVVVKRLSPPWTINPNVARSFDQEISLLRQSEIVAIVKVRDVKGELADGGTWIHTRITAEVDRLIYSSGVPGHLIEFGFAAGRTMIGAVSVTAGTFAQFNEGEKYLVFLSYDPGIKRLFPATAFHLSADGSLERLRDNRGVEQSTMETLAGRKIADVVQALELAK